jgi:outer membrane autotransporter protein
MKNLLLSGLIVAAVLIVRPASAQSLTNGSFTTGDFSGWTTAGTPSVFIGANPAGAPPTPVPGDNQALINSTDTTMSGVYSSVNSVPAATLNTFLDLTVPLPGTAGGTHVPLNGEAIQQTFTTTGRSRITFLYQYNSREAFGNGGDGFDETGYVLNGVFHILADPSTPGQSITTVGGFVFGLPYLQGSVIVGPGTNTLGFVAYNTGTEISPSGLFLTDIMITPFVLVMPGLTPNQQAVATNIDDNIPSTNPNFTALVTALGAATTATQLGDDLDQLSPQSLQVFRNIAFDNATFNTLDVTNHLANLRDGLTGFDDSQLTVNDPSLSPGASRIKGRLRDPKDMTTMRDAKDMKEMQPAYASEPPDRWSIFIVGDVILADLGHDQDLAHQDYTTGSIMIGTDYRIDDHFTIGGLLAYSHTDVDLDHVGSSATVDTYSPGLYASYVDGGWYGNALVTYGFNSYTEDRNILIGDVAGTNHGAPQGNQYTASLTGGYEFRSGNFKYGPIAGVQYVNLGINSFSEDGPIPLNVQSESDESFRTQLGVEVRYVVRAGSIVLTPHASATWQHEFLDDNNGITSQFNGLGGAFTVQTTPIDRDSAVIDVGLNADVTDNVTLFADYQTEVGQSDFFAQSVAAGVKIGF